MIFIFFVKFMLNYVDFNFHAKLSGKKLGFIFKAFFLQRAKNKLDTLPRKYSV